MKKSFIKKTNNDLENDYNKINSSFSGFENVNYWHYTTANNLKNILDIKEDGNRYFFLSCIENTNDINEAKRLNDAKNTFILSLCESYREIIPMWSMYSNFNNEKGVAISLKAKDLNEFIKSIKYVYPVKNNIIDFKRKIEINDFEIIYGRVLYYRYNEKGNDGSICVHMYTTGMHVDEPYFYYVLDKNYNFESNKIYIKDSEWEYEREFRVTIKLKENKGYDKIAIIIPKKTYEKFYYYRSPIIYKKDEWENYVYKTKRIKDSKIEIIKK